MVGAGLKNRYAWVILGILFISQAALALGTYAWGPLGPFIIQSLSLSHVQFGAITTTLYLSAVLCSIPAGIAVDRWGVKINLIICMLVMGAALILAGYVETYIGLMVFVTFVGVSYSMINPVVSKSLTLWFDAKTRATAFGIRQVSVTVGGALADTLLIYLTELKNWNFAVLAVGSTTVLIGVIGALLYKEPPAENDESTGIKKTIAKTSLLDLVKNRTLLRSCLIMALLCFGQSSIVSFVVLYLIEDIELTAIMAGSFLTITMVCGGFARVFWGILSDKLFDGRRLPVMKIICLMAVVSTLSIVLCGSNLSPVFFIPIMVLFGFSYLGFQGVGVVLMVEACTPEMAGRATGFGITVVWSGMALGPVVFGALTEHGYPLAWTFVTLTSLLAVLVCYTIDE